MSRHGRGKSVPGRWIRAPGGLHADCLTHAAFGVPRAEFLPDGSSGPKRSPYQATMENSCRLASIPPAKSPGRCNPWRRTQSSTPRTASTCGTPIMRSWRPTPHSSSAMFSSTQTASSVGCTSTLPTIRTISQTTRALRDQHRSWRWGGNGPPRSQRRVALQGGVGGGARKRSAVPGRSWPET